MLRDPDEHPWPNLVPLVKCEDEVGPLRPTEGAV